MRGKRRELRKHARKKKLHCIILFNPKMNVDPNFYHLTGFDGYGCMVLLKDKEYLFVPKMELERAKKTVKGIKVRAMDNGVSDAIKRYTKGKAIGIDFNAVTLSLMKSLRKEFRKKKFIDISSVLLELRKLKNKKETNILKKACRISDNILKRCFARFKKFRTEREVADFLEEETVKSGCKLSFNPIVASGKNASEPHHTPKNTKLGKGFCVIDFGIRYMGYCTDTTRTIYIGKPTKKDGEIYDLVLRTQKELIGELHPGKRCSEIYDECVKKLAHYGRYFSHGLGHGVGIEVHELPNLKPKSRDRIEKGEVFTVEPGIYVPGRFGIRIEDSICMGNRPLVLTRVNKGFRCV